MNTALWLALRTTRDVAVSRSIGALLCLRRTSKAFVKLSPLRIHWVVSLIAAVRRKERFVLCLPTPPPAVSNHDIVSEHILERGNQNGQSRYEITQMALATLSHDDKSGYQNVEIG